MAVSKFLSKVIGIYLIIVSIALLVNMQQFINLVNTLINDAPLMFVSGFFTLILGILMVVSHNIWQWNWRVLITIISWLTLFKGASIVLYPQFIDSMTILFVGSMNIAYIAAGMDLVLGVVLCYFGFRHTYDSV